MFDLRWEGPFRWPGLDAEGGARAFDEDPVAKSCGIYLWTVEHLDGFLIYAVGITRRPFARRFREHTQAYRTGVYTLFDIPSLKDGIRKEIWHGFWTKKRSRRRLVEYDRRREELRAAADRQLANYRVFVAPVGPVPRILQRIEAAIMDALYAAPGPASVIPDRGMALAPRRRQERPILVRNVVPVLLHGFPLEFEA